MRLKKVKFRGDVNLLGRWKSSIEASGDFDLWCDGTWVWVEFLRGELAGQVAGVSSAAIDSIIPEDPDEARRRRGPNKKPAEPKAPPPPATA